MKRIVRAAGLLLLAAAALLAQKSGTKPFLALMQPQNEVPAVTDTSSANALILAHGVIDNKGNVTSATIDFDIETKFSGPVTVTGLHIHHAPAGQSGPIVIPTDVNGSDNSIQVDSTGRVHIRKSVQVPSATLATVQDLIANPQNYYVNIHTTDHPAGAARGQLVPADSAVVVAGMSGKNEVPSHDLNGTAAASVIVLRGQGADGPLATAIFNLDYMGFDPGTLFTGFHIHNGAAGVNGPVIISSGLSGTNSVAVDSTGAGNLNFLVPMSPLDANFANEIATVNSLFVTPGRQYINLHTTTFPGGVIRDQLHATEKVEFPVTLSPANETPPVTGLNASAPGTVILFVTRGGDGSVDGGMVLWDIDFLNFPANTTITGLHVHQAAPGVAGGIVLASGVNSSDGKVVSDTGSGNIFRYTNVFTDTGMTALNGILANPNNYYANLHTTVNPGGAIRDQLAPALGKPAINGIAANASTVTAVAPGTIIAIYGSNLAPVASDLSGFGSISALATSMNGVSVTVGGQKAPFYYVGPNQINAQVPLETATGTQQVVVTNAAGSATSSITVSAVAPSIFIVDANGTGAIVKNADFSLITAANKATAGDVIVIYLTGLGQTTPSVQTGVLVQPPSGGFNNTAPVAVTIGGQNAPVTYSIASPGFTGLYQIAVTVPAGVSGHVPLIVKAGGASSNTVNIDVQ